MSGPLQGVTKTGEPQGPLDKLAGKLQSAFKSVSDYFNTPENTQDYRFVVPLTASKDGKTFAYGATYGTKPSGTVAEFKASDVEEGKLKIFTTKDFANYETFKKTLFNKAADLVADAYSETHERAPIPSNLDMKDGPVTDKDMTKMIDLLEKTQTERVDDPNIRNQMDYVRNLHNAVGTKGQFDQFKTNIAAEINKADDIGLGQKNTLYKELGISTQNAAPAITPGANL
jgi:hypothetical protein